ncbi:MAG: TIGR04255 family protein [bacterium]
MIFEAFWELDVDDKSRSEYDPGFELAQGVFSSYLSKDYPHHRKIAPPLAPLQLLNHKPVHQFWTAPNEWPVIQLGPGILAANITEKTYVWETKFQPVILQALDALLRSYKEPPQFKKVSLRYIDAVELNTEAEDSFLQFIESHLQIKVVKEFDISGRIKGQSISQVYSLDDNSQLQIVISNGMKNNNPVIVWQTAILKETKFTPDDIKQWIQYAHSSISALFKRMLRKEYYDSLR